MTCTTPTPAAAISIFSFALPQSADQFSESGSQSGVGNTATTQYTGPPADPNESAVTAGTLIHRQVTFERDICDFEGGFVEGRSNRITGTMACSYALNGVNNSVSGQWQVDRTGN